MQKAILSIILVFGSPAYSQGRAIVESGIASGLKDGSYRVDAVEPAKILCESQKVNVPRVLNQKECVLTITHVDGRLKKTKVLAQKEHCALKVGEKVELKLNPLICRDSERLKCDDLTAPNPSYQTNSLACSIHQKVKYWVRQLRGP